MAICDLLYVFQSNFDNIMKPLKCENSIRITVELRNDAIHLLLLILLINLDKYVKMSQT